VLKFNAQGPDGLIDRKAPGQPSRLNDRLAVLNDIGEGLLGTAFPAINHICHKRHWKQVLHQEVGGNDRSFAGPGYRRRLLPARLEAIGREKGADPGAIELWFADEARVGQKNKITRRWAKRGSRPSAPIDQRTASAYIFGAVCPKEGKGAALIMPRCDTEAMNLHLAEIAMQIAPGAHAAILVDQAGWHLSGKLRIPSNITLIPLPAKCPELNPVENVWEFMRDNWLSNRIFKSYDDIVDRCCDAWNRLIDQPWKIMSIATRDWAYRS